MARSAANKKKRRTSMANKKRTVEAAKRRRIKRGLRGVGLFGRR